MKASPIKNRRMITQALIESDKLMSSVSCKAFKLYIVLIVNADDDGVVVDINKSLVISGTRLEELEELIAYRLLTAYIDDESGDKVFIINDWARTQHITPKLYVPSRYTKIVDMHVVKGHVPTIGNDKAIIEQSMRLGTKLPLEMVNKKLEEQIRKDALKNRELELPNELWTTDQRNMLEASMERYDRLLAETASGGSNEIKVTEEREETQPDICSDLMH